MFEQRLLFLSGHRVFSLMQLIHATTGESLAIPAIIGSLVEPSLQDVLNLITNEHFASRGERCLRLLENGTRVIDDWGSISTNAVLLVITSRAVTSTAAGGGNSTDGPSSPRRVIDSPQVMSPNSPLRRSRHSVRGSDNYSLPTSRLRAYVESVLASDCGRTEDAPPPPHLSPSAVIEEAMPTSAINVASAIARNRGKVLITSMNELIEDQKEAERQLRETRNHNAAAAVTSANAAMPIACDDEDDEDHITMLLLSHVPNDALTQMTEFGFSFQASVRALLQCRFALESAVSHVLSNDQEALGLPLTRAELQTFSSWYLHPAPPPPPALSLPPQPAAEGSNVTSAVSDATPSSLTRPAEFLQLLEMGFAPSQVRRALRGADGNVSEACSALLGDPNALQRVEQRNAELVWLDPIETAVQRGTLSAAGVIHCVEKITADPQAILNLWYERQADFRRLCELFSPSLQQPF